MTTITLSASQLAEARAWLADCEFVETEMLAYEDRVEWFAERSDAAICRAVARHFEGGVAGFVALGQVA